MLAGWIVKALSGFYYVIPDGATTSEPVQCRARGIFKLNNMSPLVGDYVTYEVSATGEGTINEIQPRASELIRPPIANVQQAILIFSIVEPALHLQLLDKFLVHIEHEGLEPVICLTKHDLLRLDDKSSVALIEQAISIYERMGYPVIVTSTKQQTGLSQVKERLRGRISVFSGQSGVGKSSLVNALVPNVTMETNQISKKLGRGKHTTRHVQLIPLPEGGWVADTPGFSQLDFLQIEAEQLSNCFREFRALSQECKFRSCLHHQEPGCRVRQAVENGEIAESRYAHYGQFLQEIKERKRRY